MLVICITHADAAKVGTQQFRALTEDGRQHVVEAARRLRAAIPKLAPDIAQEITFIKKIVSSPLARCLETVIIFATELKDYTATSEVQVSDHLKEKRGQRLTPHDLDAVVSVSAEADVLLLGTHGDLASVLPDPAKVRGHAGGFFDGRPVVAIFECRQGRPWAEANLRYCDGYFGGWVNLLEL